MTNYITYGNICNRYCLKKFDRKTVSFSKPCRLKKEKRKELKARNERHLEPHDEDGNFEFDEPFPNTPQKMPIEFVECEAAPGVKLTYGNFVKVNELQSKQETSGKRIQNALNIFLLANHNSMRFIPYVILFYISMSFPDFLDSTLASWQIGNQPNTLLSKSVHDFTQAFLAQVSKITSYVHH